jgi:hypothetical protein
LFEEPIADNQTMNSVIDMDLSSPSSQELRDHDERFRVPTPPPLPPSTCESLTRNQTLSNEPNKLYDDPDYKDRSLKLVEQLKQLKSSNLLITTKTESIIPIQEAVFKACFEQSESSSSSEDIPTDDNHTLIINEDLQSVNTINLPLVQDDSNRSRDEFVKLLTKEAYVSKSSSPAKKQDNPKHSYDYPKYRRRSHDDNEINNSSNTHRHNTRPSDRKTQ